MEPSSVFDALVAAARPVILDHYAADSCIASTRIAIEALAYFGISAEPLALKVLILNAEAARATADGVKVEDLEYLPADEPGGPWTVGVGVEPAADSSRWAGHLVATVPEQQVVIDVSIDQAARPHKQLYLQPYWLRLPDARWWSGDRIGSPLAGSDGTVMILDRDVVDADGYKVSPQWCGRRDEHRIRRVTGEVIRAMKLELSSLHA